MGESGGTFRGSTSVDFASDVSAAVSYLKSRAEVDEKKIGLIGHSEGGLIAPMVASSNTDVSFIVLLAGPGVNGVEIMATQNVLVNRQSGMAEDKNAKIDAINRQIYQAVLQSPPNEIVAKDLLAEKYFILGQADSPNIAVEYTQLTSQWFQFFLAAEPKKYLSKVQIPVLAMNGDKDTQVAAELNLSAIESILNESNNKRFTIELIPNLNHLFQTAKTGSVNEYASNEETFSPVALKIMGDWISGL